MAEICAEGNASASRGAKREHNRAGWRINALQQRLGNHIDRAETLFVGNHEVVVKHTALQQVIEQWEEHLMAERERERVQWGSKASWRTRAGQEKLTQKRGNLLEDEYPIGLCRFHGIGWRHCIAGRK